MSFRQELIDLRGKYLSDLEIKQKELEKKEQNRKAEVASRIISEAKDWCKKAASQGKTKVKIMDLVKWEDYNYFCNKTPVINPGSIVDLVIIAMKELELNCKISHFFDGAGNIQFSLYASWE